MKTQSNKMSNRTFFITTLIGLTIIVPMFMYFLGLFWEAVNNGIKFANSFM